MINSKELMEAPTLPPPIGGSADEKPETTPAAGIDTPVDLPRAGAGDVFAIPFADCPTRFWEKTVVFSAISLLGTAGGAWMVYRGWHTPSILAAAFACGITSGAAVCVHRSGRRARRPMRWLRCVAAATTLSFALLALLLEIGRIAFLFPSWGQSVTAAVVSCFLTYCTACFVVPMAAAFSPGQWSGAASRLALNWHRALGTLVLTTAYLLTVVPAGLLVAPAPRFAMTRLARIARIPLWSWLMPLYEVSRMAISLLEPEPVDGRRSAWAVAGSVIRRIVTIPLVMTGMVYALLTTAAHVLTRLSCEVMAEKKESEEGVRSQEPGVRR